MIAYDINRSDAVSKQLNTIGEVITFACVVLGGLFGLVLGLVVSIYFYQALTGHSGGMPFALIGTILGLIIFGVLGKAVGQCFAAILDWMSQVLIAQTYVVMAVKATVKQPTQKQSA